MSRFQGEYPAEWKALADAVKSAAWWRCIRCNHPDRADVLPRGRICDEYCTHAVNGKQRVLTVHHFDGNKENQRAWNLMALCQACHLSIQVRVIPAQGYAFYHTPWIIPYVAGYYLSSLQGVDVDFVGDLEDDQLADVLLMAQPTLRREFYLEIIRDRTQSMELRNG